jgi:hypothetical protein
MAPVLCKKKWALQVIFCSFAVTSTVNSLTEYLHCGIPVRATAFESIALLGERLTRRVHCVVSGVGCCLRVPSFW